MWNIHLSGTVWRALPEWTPAGSCPGGACAVTTIAHARTMKATVDSDLMASVADVRSGRELAGFVLAARFNFGDEAGVGVGVQADLGLGQHARLDQDLGVLDRDRIVQHVAFAANPLDDVQLLRVEEAPARQPRPGIEADRVDHQRVAFPAADRS